MQLIKDIVNNMIKLYNNTILEMQLIKNIINNIIRLYNNTILEII